MNKSLLFLFIFFIATSLISLNSAYGLDVAAASPETIQDLAHKINCARNGETITGMDGSVYIVDDFLRKQFNQELLEMNLTTSNSGALKKSWFWDMALENKGMISVIFSVLMDNALNGKPYSIKKNIQYDQRYFTFDRNLFGSCSMNFGNRNYSMKYWRVAQYSTAIILICRKLY